MNKKHKKKILLKLQAAANKVELNPEAHDGDMVKAAANRTATRINILHPYAQLFDESFKKKMLGFMAIGRKAEEEGDEASLSHLAALTDTIDTLITDTLEKMIKKL